MSRKGWFVLIGVPALFICVYWLAYYPSLLKLPLCAVKLFLGIDCPGCGMTRSLALLTHGRFRESIYMHPFGVFFAMWLFYIFTREILTILTGRQMPQLLSRKASNIVIMTITFALIGQWVIKLCIKFIYHL